MAKYEFSDAQVKNLRVIIADANIKGSAAIEVVAILQSLNKPIVEVKNEGTKAD